ncbi:hypothetical protein T08_5480 [Trichinella sp. T8]|nr:hypothetical protein T08_5480 [Trichinella sp. T8]
MTLDAAEFPKAGDHGGSGHSKADALCTGGSGTDDLLHHVLERKRGRTCVGKVGRQQLKAIRPQLGIQWWHGPRWLTGPPQTWPRSQEDTERTPLIPSDRNDGPTPPQIPAPGEEWRYGEVVLNQRLRPLLREEFPRPSGWSPGFGLDRSHFSLIGR